MEQLVGESGMAMPNSGLSLYCVAPLMRPMTLIGYDL
jgi:hypothetical protein